MITDGCSLHDWERRRAVLSHDILKNQLMPAIFKLSKILEKKVVDDEFLVSFSSRFTKDISYIDSEIHMLCDTAKKFLTPRQFFLVQPLAGVDSETQSWLPDLIHSLWVDSSTLTNRLGQILQVFERVRTASAPIMLTRDFQSPDTIQDVAALKQVLSELSDTVSSLRTLLPYYPLIDLDELEK